MLLPQASADLPADLHKLVAAGYRESYLTIISQVLVSISVPKSNQPHTITRNHLRMPGHMRSWGRYSTLWRWSLGQVTWNQMHMSRFSWNRARKCLNVSGMCTYGSTKSKLYIYILNESNIYIYLSLSYSYKHAYMVCVVDVKNYNIIHFWVCFHTALGDTIDLCMMELCPSISHFAIRDVVSTTGIIWMPSKTRY